MSSISEEKTSSESIESGQEQSPLTEATLICQATFLTSCVTPKVWLRVLVISLLLTTAFLWHAPALAMYTSYEEKLVVCESCGHQLCSHQNGNRQARKTITQYLVFLQICSISFAFKSLTNLLFTYSLSPGQTDSQIVLFLFLHRSAR